jgi:uncharacterized protein YegP (UPF0339 family)
MAAKFELKKGASGQFRFNLIAMNGRIILSSEQYNSRAAAMNGIESFKKNASNDANYERKTSRNNEPYFVLKAPNKQIIGRSQMYSSGSSMSKGIASVKKNTRGAKVKDLTK